VRMSVVLVSCLLTLAGSAFGQDSTPEGGGAVPAERRRPTDLEALARRAFAPDRLKARREALLASLPKGAVIVLVAPKRSSEIMGYRPNPHMLYLTGQSQPRLSILLSPDEDVLFAPPSDKRWERWNGARLSVGSELAKKSGFGEVVLRSARRARIEASLKKHGGPLFVLGAKSEELGLDKKLPTRSPGGVLGRLRQVKDKAEIALLQRSADVTCAALGEAIRSIRPGQYEYEIQAVIEYVFARYGAQRVSFTTIVGSGPNSCVLHYSANRRRTGPGELIVMDVGSELFGYAADVTRTVPSSGTFSPRQREIYELVLKAQQAGIEAIKPGATMRSVDAAARKVIKDAGYGRYFLHSTSHWLGLDVHDVGPRARPLQPGMVLTVEPGIYISKENIGVRIEDDILVTKTGYRVLSDGVPKTVAALEALMSGKGVGARRVTPLPARKTPASKPKKPRYFDLRLR
jgi:Xaa-Pro aminopeptidase